LTSLRLLSSQLFALRIEVETADELGNAGQGNQGLVGRAPLAVREQVDAQLAQALLGSNMLWANEDSSLNFVETKCKLFNRNIRFHNKISKCILLNLP